MKLYTSYWEELSLMGVTTLLFLRVKMNKVKSLTSLEEILCCGIKEWDILEKWVFNHHKVNVWLKVCLIVIQVLIYVNIVYMARKIESNFHLVLQGKMRSWSYYIVMCLVLYLFYHWKNLSIMLDL